MFTYIKHAMETIVSLTHVFDMMQCVNDKGYCNISHPYLPT